jgi:hypothetical protein
VAMKKENSDKNAENSSVKRCFFCEIKFIIMRKIEIVSEKIKKFFGNMKKSDGKEKEFFILPFNI